MKLTVTALGKTTSSWLNLPHGVVKNSMHAPLMSSEEGQNMNIKHIWGGLEEKVPCSSDLASCKVHSSLHSCEHTKEHKNIRGDMLV